MRRLPGFLSFQTSKDKIGLDRGDDGVAYARVVAISAVAKNSCKTYPKVG